MKRCNFDIKRCKVIKKRFNVKRKKPKSFVHNVIIELSEQKAQVVHNVIIELSEETLICIILMFEIRRVSFIWNLPWLFKAFFYGLMIFYPPTSSSENKTKNERKWFLKTNSNDWKNANDDFFKTSSFDFEKNCYWKMFLLVFLWLLGTTF